jgi:Uma2 family endonuclease
MSREARARFGPASSVDVEASTVSTRCYAVHMHAHALATDRDDSPQEDHIVVLDGTWADFQRMLEARGDRSAPRLAYRKGLLEIMSPSQNHEWIKSLLGRFVEVFCLESGVEFSAFGSWTLEDKELQSALEPDECYVLGAKRSATRPDLAIEVVWTSGGLKKLDIYRALGVGEVWIWRKARLMAWLLGEDGYVESTKSRALPNIDLAQLVLFLDRPTTSAAIRAYRDALRAG